MKQDNQREATLYAYIAGIIDGEGTIRIGKSKTNYYASISIGMTEKKVIKLISSMFGAKVRIECVPNRKIIYRWGTSGNIVIPKIIKKIYPYLIVKKKQADLILMFCKKPEIGKKQCRICKSEKIHGYGLCVNCYMKLRRKKEIENWKITPAKYLSKKELQRRKELYLTVKKLNAVGAPATTKQDDTREGEVIV